MAETWRLIPEASVPAAINMATDSWLLEQLIGDRHPPTLRFYRWQPIAISLGYHQKSWPQHWQSLTWNDQLVDLVRRPTGGRAVLHQGDLTYAISMPLAVPRQEAYRTICDALIETWGEYGVALDYGTAGRGYRNQTNCFALATAADLTTPEGYKLIGSAQLRRDRCLLQHGSIRLNPDRALYQRVFGGETASPISPPGAIPTVPTDQWRASLCAAIAENLGRSLGVEFQTHPLDSAEQSEIVQRAEQFAISQGS